MPGRFHPRGPDLPRWGTRISEASGGGGSVCSVPLMVRIWIERLPGISRSPVGEDEPTSRNLCARHRKPLSDGTSSQCSIGPPPTTREDCRFHRCSRRDPLFLPPSLASRGASDARFRSCINTRTRNHGPSSGCSIRQNWTGTPSREWSESQACVADDGRCSLKASRRGAIARAAPPPFAGAAPD